MNKKAVGLLIGSGLVLLLCLLAALGTATGSPDTFIVNSTADPGDGTCDATECTLREAIDAANAIPGSDIEFNIPITDTGYMVSGITGTWTISLTSSLPTLSGRGYGHQRDYSGCKCACSNEPRRSGDRNCGGGHGLRRLSESHLGQ
ncbi:MAG: CSLREA domain-containing protein [Anaerolineae bacterium]